MSLIRDARRKHQRACIKPKNVWVGKELKNYQDILMAEKEKQNEDACVEPAESEGEENGDEPTEE